MLITFTLMAVTAGTAAMGTASSAVAARQYLLDEYVATFSTLAACNENGKWGMGSHWDGYLCKANGRGAFDLYVRNRR